MHKNRLIIAFCCLGLMACWSAVSVRLGAPSNTETIAHGKSIVQGLAACGFCHGETASPLAVLSGGQVLEDRYGEVIAPNLTPHSTGLEGWTASELITVLRNSISKDERKLSKDFHRGYEWMSDKDMLSVVAYLGTLPPVEGKFERRELSFLDRNVAGFSQSWRAYDNFVPRLQRTEPVAYGRYLVDHVAQCDSCHASPEGWFSSGAYLEGGRIQQGPTGERYVPGISNAETDGIGNWSQHDIVEYLQSGRTPDGRTIDSDYCPIPFYARAEQSDIEAIAHYLKSLQ